MDAFVKTLIERAKQTPYFHLDGYMHRWWLTDPPTEGSPQSARIHEILRSDTDNALHDHPWPSISIVLDGGYWEVMPYDQKQHPRLDASHFEKIWRAPGDVVMRQASDRHKLILPDGERCFSLFIMGPWEKDWGFYDPERGFVYWRDYLADYTTAATGDPAPGECVRAR